MFRVFNLLNIKSRPRIRIRICVSRSRRDFFFLQKKCKEIGTVPEIFLILFKLFN